MPPPTSSAGTATGSENDRSTALEYLRRADEAPSDTVVLFNEAVAMEDRGQVMNAVETWHRYLSFERDPSWLAEGRSRLEALEQKLNRLKTHQSRMEQHLASPLAMTALASDPAALGALDEELSSSLLPKILGAAFPLPVDRSRGSPCDPNCQAARALLHALAASLERNHQDNWLTQHLPPIPLLPQRTSFKPHRPSARRLMRTEQATSGCAEMGAPGPTALSRPGQSRWRRPAQVELAYAFQRFSNHPGCYRAAHTLLDRNPQFAWIQIHALTEDTQCDPTRGKQAENDPAFERVVSFAQDRNYTLLELRARNLLGAPAVDNGDTEAAWRIYLPSVRKFLRRRLSGLEALYHPFFWP